MGFVEREAGDERCEKSEGTAHKQRMRKTAAGGHSDQSSPEFSKHLTRRECVLFDKRRKVWDEGNGEEKVTN